MTFESLFVGAAFVAHLAAIVMVLLYERRQPTATLAWVLSLLLLPVIGVVFWALFGITRYRRTRRRSRIAGERIDAVRQALDVGDKLDADKRAAGEDPRARGLLELGAAVASTSASPGNDVRLLVDGAVTYRAILRDVERAQHHVHVCFYIIQPDVTGRSLRDRLANLARRGVQVRVLCDAVGSARLPRDFWDPLTDAGGQAAYFSPVIRSLHRWRRRDRIDFRNHRKIVVVDGRVGFTGGINIGREYLGLDPEVGKWRDSHVRIDGPAVLSLQSTFAEDWLTATGETIDDAEHFPVPGVHADGETVQVIDSGPDSEWSPIESMYAFAIQRADQRLWITNPYFVPSPVIEEALVAAALRGVDVRLLVPQRSDHLLVELASHSYYPRLLEAGARVFLYRRGFVHAKAMVVDDWLASVGSANMDIRSFRLNFELNPFVLGQRFNQTCAAQFVEDLRHADETSLQREAARPPWERAGSSLARLLSPLL